MSRAEELLIARRRRENIVYCRDVLGYSFQAIAAQHGFSRQRAYQLYKREKCGEGLVTDVLKGVHLR